MDQHVLPVPIGGTTALETGTGPGDLTDALRSARAYAMAEKSAATRRAYASDWDHFRAWCYSHAVAPLPAAVETVAAYLASLADARLKASTIMRRTAAIAYAHRLAGSPPPTAAEPTKAVLRGIRRRVGVAVEQKAPATARAITAMLKGIPDTMQGRRDRALLLIGFAAALRRSELVALTVADLERTPEGVVIHIRRSKTDQEGEGHQVAVPIGGKLRPVQALDAWLSAAAITEGPVFRAVNRGGRVAAGALSDHAVADIVKRRAAAAGLDTRQFSGHSLRAGFVTSALESGADLLKVMDVTRHREVRTLKAYDRRAKAFRDHAGRKFL
ncbi:Tyrosine recombinase XerD [Rhodoplanes serenus]|uniref:Tyrosine recombinase XerD n=1 Tax=Rhodoplanes serenus TaxID=200615 RepID=A0A3S4CJJ5_9BRAD|nr:site-specific integrase [Rhodoplanes serenus]VCU10787.1 Tyrosine recombinase XerD [Rhodoplanes serenus]